jgi:hypothetical protein
MPDHKDLVMDQLSSEYKILQDKIDKIGAFKFTIRGWSVTLVVASIFAAGSAKLVSPYLLLLLFIFLGLFFAAEYKQHRFQSLFGTRAFQIEKEMWRILRSRNSGEIALSPRIAHHLSDDALRLTPSGHFPKLKRWLMDPDGWFYIAQMLAIVVAIAVLVHTTTEREQKTATPPVSILEYRKDVVITDTKTPPSAEVYENKKKRAEAGQR